MQFVCDAPPKTWFRFETQGEADTEAAAMAHAVDKYFRQAHDTALKSYVPPKSGAAFEQSIGRKDHIQKVMPLFLTLRDREGTPLVTAMLPPGGRENRSFRPIIVGRANMDPYPDHGPAIAALATHFKLALDRERCFPYRH
ncbi:MAG TPA: hypothetical protein PK264_15965 [Hyphomicrobiaceae bacterium]|nr:hypothetical protein [Hyphomicrobiaceae bacterium]